MANYVDFSNATIRCVNRDVFNTKNHFGLYSPNSGNDVTPRFSSVTSPTDYVATISSKYIGNKTEHGFSIYLDGTFNTSGNEFYISFNNNNDSSNPSYMRHGWKVSNIQFEAGDLFSCQINVNVTYS